MGFEKMYSGIILASLCFFALMSFGVGFGEDNKTDVSILDNSALNNSFNRIENNLSANQDTAQRQRQIFEDEDVQVGFGELIFFGVISTVKTFSSMIVGVFSIMVVPLFILFKFGVVVIGSISAILLGRIIFKSWKLQKQGE